MLDFSFSELLVCFLVALVVLGPEKLPRVARGIGRWTGQARAYMRNLSAELDRESHASDLRRQMEDARRVFNEESSALKRELSGVSSRLNESATASADAAPPATPGTPTAPTAAVTTATAAGAAAGVDDDIDTSDFDRLHRADPAPSEPPAAAPRDLAPSIDPPSWTPPARPDANG